MNASPSSAVSTSASAAYAAWRAVVEKELAGAPFAKKLVSRTVEGLELQPLYHPGMPDFVEPAPGLPGQAPYVRGFAPAPPRRSGGWEIWQVTAAGVPGALNRELLAALARGLNSVWLPLDAATRRGAAPAEASDGEVAVRGLSLVDRSDLATVLREVVIGVVPVHLDAGAIAAPLGALVEAVLAERGIDWGHVRGSVAADPLATLATAGRLPTALESCWDDLAGWTQYLAAKNSPVRSAALDAGWVADSGGHAVQELAFALAMAAEALRALRAREVALAAIAPRLRVSFAVGPQFYTEIAKFRAFRALWARLWSAFGDVALAASVHVHARTAQWNKTVFDPYVNLLRATTETLSAVLGGAHSVQIGPFDEPVRVPDEFSQRLARNLALMLAEEFDFDAVADPAGGAWLFERHADDLARRAWALFQEIEGEGGFSAALRAGSIASRLAASRSEKTKAVDHRRLAILGTNLFPNLREKPLPGGAIDAAALRAARVAELSERRAGRDVQKFPIAHQPHFPLRFGDAVIAYGAGATLPEIAARWVADGPPGETVAPVVAWRAAAGFEQLRRAVDAQAKATGRRPQVFLAKMGPVKQHKVRADFALGFFAVAGFEALAKEAFADAASAAAAAARSGAPIAVLCSTDDTYGELVPAFGTALKASAPGVTFVLAGLPAEAATVEAFRAAGVDEFLHLRANARELLAALLRRAGVTLD
jgi:methylmalonyl-CoA mutase